MPDIELRFHTDMLTVSAPIDAALARQGIDLTADLEFLLVTEPDLLQEAMRMELLAGAQCLTLPTRALTPAQLAHLNATDRLLDLARAAFDLVRTTRETAQPITPQHLIAEIGFCGLPLDPSSATSLNEHRDQYARAVRAFEAAGTLDAYLLSGFADAAALKCALMGARQATDHPVLACVDVAADGSLASGRGTVEDAAAVAAEYGAGAIGFATGAPLSSAVTIAKRIADACGLPVLAELDVRERALRQAGPTDDNPYYSPDTMVEAAIALRAAGVQFLRAGGEATCAYTGALAAVAGGMPAPSREDASAGELPTEQSAASEIIAASPFEDSVNQTLAAEE